MRKDKRSDKTSHCRFILSTLHGESATTYRSSYDAYIGHFVSNVCVSKNVSNIKMVHSFSNSGTENFIVVENKSLELFIHGDVLLSLSDIRRATHGQVFMPVAPTACSWTVIVWCILHSVTCFTSFLMKTFDLIFILLNLHFSIDITVMPYDI